MPDDRTTITELGTALGTLPFPIRGLRWPLVPTSCGWDPVLDLLDTIVAGSRLTSELHTAFANGRAFLEAGTVSGVENTSW